MTHVAGSIPDKGRTIWPLSDRAREAALAYLCLTPWIVGFLVFTLGAMLFSFGLAFTANTPAIASTACSTAKSPTVAASSPLAWM
mgnify:CR=1 FL=1